MYACCGHDDGCKGFFIPDVALLVSLAFAAATPEALTLKFLSTLTA